MKPIRITHDNEAVIQAALKEVNGNAKLHTYTDYHEVAAMATMVEQKLSRFLPKKAWKGAKWVETSGSAVSNAYSKKAFGPRPATTLTLEYRASGWFLVGIHKASVYQDGGGDGRLHLTRLQADEAVARFSSSFTVEKAS